MSFSAKIGQWSKNSLLKVDQKKRAVCLKLFSAVILDTPVLTGRLRSNWRCSVGDMDLGTDDSTDKSGSATIAKMSNTVASATGKPMVPIFLSNSLPYAARIEFDGWSHTKAPQGMVRRNVARFNQLLKENEKK